MLPVAQRARSVVSIVIYALIATAVLARADLVSPGIPKVSSARATWVVVAYCFGAGLDLASRSKPERSVMSPVSAVLGALFAVVALSWATRWNRYTGGGRQHPNSICGSARHTPTGSADFAGTSEENGVVSEGSDWYSSARGGPRVKPQGSAAKSTARGLWVWPVAILLGFPIGGYVADLAMDGVDSAVAALVEGLIAGVIVGAAEWFALRRWVSWLWIPATCVGMAVGLTAGAAVVDYGIGRGDLALMGALTGLAVGLLQAVVLVQAGHSISDASLWAVATSPAWALGWFVSSYVIARNIGERFPVFGASGAIVFGLLTWLLLAALIRQASETQGTRDATAQ